MKIALIVLCFWMGSAFASECTDEVKKNAFDRLSRDKNAENIKVGVKIKSYGTLVTWSLDTTHKVGSEIRDISILWRAIWNTTKIVSS